MICRNLKYLSILVMILLAGCQGANPEEQIPTLHSPSTSTPTAMRDITLTPTTPVVVDQEIYLGQLAPGTQPEIFLPGVISTEGIELFFALHPNLKEAYFTRVAGGRSMIMVTFFKGNEWTDPVPVSFSSEFQDVGPFITVDGERLFFWSNRPLTPTTPLIPYLQIWVVEREENGWGEPKDLLLPIESLNGEWDVSVTADGRMYYMANYPSLGGYGLYRIEEVGGSFQSGRADRT
jgi:hypothetical protein